MSELGTKLRDARIEKGYTLNTLQQMTKIQKKYLVAIEEGRFEEIPGNFYTRAFVKQYADMVGLDGDSLLLDYHNELEAVEHGLSQYDDQEAEAMPSRLNRNQAQSEQSLLDRYAKHLPVLMLAGVFVLVMAFITWTIYSVSQRERQQQANNSSSTSLVSSVEPSSAAQHAASSSSETSSQAKIDGAEFFGDVQGKRVSGEGEETTYELYAPMNKFKFTVKGKNYVWVGVYEDEEITMDTTVTEGETLEIKVKGQTRSVRIRLGYPEGGEIQVNGKTVKIANDYITDSIVFRLHADQPTGSSANEANQAAENQQGQDQNQNQNQNQGQGSYQGPAVLDPNRQQNNDNNGQ